MSTHKTITAAQIAERENVNIHTARRWFRSGAIAGRKIGHNWTTTEHAYRAWRSKHPQPADYPLDVAAIAKENAVSVKTVRTWFNQHGLPGVKTRTHWRTTREAFDQWFATYLTSR